MLTIPRDAVLLAVLVGFVVLLTVLVDPMLPATVMTGGRRIVRIGHGLLQPLAISLAGLIAVLALGVALCPGLVVRSVLHRHLLSR